MALNPYYRSPFFRPMPSNQPKVRANEQIRTPQVRLIGAEGQQIGILAIKDALQMAMDQELDLVEVAPLAKPPVCRIIDLGKYMYSLTKKEKESRKKQKQAQVKEIKLTSKIEEHDYQTKLRNGRNFLERGDKLKLSMMFRGREMAHMDLGRKILARFKEDLLDVGEVEKDGHLEGNVIHLLFSPLSQAKKLALKKALQAKKEEEALGKIPAPEKKA